MTTAKPVLSKTTISREEINALPIKRFEGPVYVIHTPEAMADAVRRLERESLLGFDTESRASFKAGVVYPVALIQLAAAEAVYIFQILRLEKIDALFNILSNPAITKVGVALREDIGRLRDRKPFPARGFVDLCSVAKNLGIEKNGLRSLTALFLHFRLSKSVQRSNWSVEKLSPKQVAYAATDAWAPREILLHLQALNLVPKHLPEESFEPREKTRHPNPHRHPGPGGHRRHPSMSPASPLSGFVRDDG